MSSNGKGRFSLSFGHRAKLYDWIKDNLASLEAEKTTYVDAATRAQKALGFALSDKHVEYICRSTDLKWSHVSRGPSGQVINQLDTLRDLVDHLACRIEAIEKALA